MAYNIYRFSETLYCACRLFLTFFTARIPYVEAPASFSKWILCTLQSNEDLMKIKTTSGLKKR